MTVLGSKARISITITSLVLLTLTLAPVDFADAEQGSSSRTRKSTLRTTAAVNPSGLGDLLDTADVDEPVVIRGPRGLLVRGRLPPRRQQGREEDREVGQHRDQHQQYRFDEQPGARPEIAHLLRRRTAP